MRRSCNIIAGRDGVNGLRSERERQKERQSLSNGWSCSCSLLISVLKGNGVFFYPPWWFGGHYIYIHGCQESFPTTDVDVSDKYLKTLINPHWNSIFVFNWSLLMLSLKHFKYHFTVFLSHSLQITEKRPVEFIFMKYLQRSTTCHKWNRKSHHPDFLKIMRRAEHVLLLWTLLEEIMF